MTAEMCGEAAAGAEVESMRATRRGRRRRVPMAARGLVFAVVVVVAAAEAGGRVASGRRTHARWRGSLRCELAATALTGALLRE